MQLKIIRIALLMLTFMAILSCDNNSLEGIYVSNLDSNDTLKIDNGVYVRKKSSKVVCANKYLSLRKGEIVFLSWANKGDLPRWGGDSLTIDAKFSCNRIIIDLDKGLYFDKIH